MSLSRALLLSLASGLLLVGCREDDRLKAVPECTPRPEICNGFDDDCDGEVDEELGTIACGEGACVREVPRCAGGVEQTCVAGEAVAEICNGIDDDCDGTVDESLMPTTCGVGECAAVSSTCAGGDAVACTPGDPSAELCDGLDNDCDGTVDEDLISNVSTDRRITHDPSSSDYVYVEASEQGFGVVWQDKRDGGAFKGDIYFAPLSKTGDRLLSSDVRLTETSGTTAHPALAWNGSRYGFVYSDDSVGNSELYFQAMEADGAKIGPAVRVTNAPNSSEWPDIVWTGDAFAVAWADERASRGKEDIFFVLLDADGKKLSEEVQVTLDPGKQQSPVLKWSGSEFGLVWTDFRNGNREIYFQRLTADGTLLGREIRVTNDSGDSAWPDLAWNGSSWAVVWQDDRDGNYEIYLATLNAKGEKQGRDVRITNANGYSGYPSIDWNGFQFGLSWQDDRGGQPAVYFVAVSATGVRNGKDLKVSTGRGQSTFTTALWNGSTFAFAWRDDRDAPAGNSEIYFAYVGCP